MALPTDLSNVKVGDTFEVDDPEQARLELAMRCLTSGQMISGSAEWDEETGKGIIRIESVSPPPTMNVEDQEKFEQLIKVLEMGKPRFPWGTVIIGLIGAAIGLAILIFGLL